MSGKASRAATSANVEAIPNEARTAPTVLPAAARRRFKASSSAYRVRATCMATGQAAGAAAALAARGARSVRDVDPAALRATLAAHGAILPPLPD